MQETPPNFQDFHNKTCQSKKVKPAINLDAPLVDCVSSRKENTMEKTDKVSSKAAKKSRRGGKVTASKPQRVAENDKLEVGKNHRHQNAAATKEHNEDLSTSKKARKGPNLAAKSPL